MANDPITDEKFKLWLSEIGVLVEKHEPPTPCIALKLDPKVDVADILVPVGTFNVEQALKELRDYYFILGEVSKVYDHVTGGVLSKQNYYASEVIGVAEEHQNELIDIAVAEALAEHGITPEATDAEA